jgi:hypothetical protein
MLFQAKLTNIICVFNTKRIDTQNGLDLQMLNLRPKPYKLGKT